MTVYDASAAIERRLRMARAGTTGRGVFLLLLVMVIATGLGGAIGSLLGPSTPMGILIGATLGGGIAAWLIRRRDASPENGS